MASPVKTISPGSSLEEKRFLFEQGAKDTFGDFRDMCLNFRSAKHKPNFEEDALRSPTKKNDKKSSTFVLQVQKVGEKIKVKDHQ